MMLTRDEARAALVRAIELRPAGWVARELALSLARLEYREGWLESARYVRRTVRARGASSGVALSLMMAPHDGAGPIERRAS